MIEIKIWNEKETNPPIKFVKRTPQIKDLFANFNIM